MALIKCPECGHEVSDKAASCPYCGMPVDDSFKSQVSSTATVVEEHIKGKEVCPHCNGTSLATHRRGWSWKNALIFGLLIAVLESLAGLIIYGVCDALHIASSIPLLPLLIIYYMIVGFLAHFIIWFIVFGNKGKDKEVVTCMTCGEQWIRGN